MSGYIQTRKARFWVWENHGWIKLTLREGDSVEFYECADHEEGFSARSACYSFDGETVELVSDSWGRCCDGPSSDRRALVASLEDLRAREPYKRGDYDYEPTPGAMLPEWRPVRHRQRDVYAERAGY